MAMDHFMEEVVVKKKNTVNRILYYLSWIVIVIGAVGAVLGLQSVMYSFNTGFDPVSLVFALICGGVAVYTFFFHDKLLTEYEYTFTNGSLDFAEVYNNKKRKSLGSLNVKNIDAFGKVASGSFQRHLNTPNLKRMNWFLNREAELYYFCFSKEGNHKMIICEPSEELVEMIKHYIPQGAWQIN